MLMIKSKELRCKFLSTRYILKNRSRFQLYSKNPISHLIVNTYIISIPFSLIFFWQRVLMLSRSPTIINQVDVH